MSNHPDPTHAPGRRPSARFMLGHPAHLLAQGFGSGLSPVMPGTSGTLFAWLSFVLLSRAWPDLFSTTTWGILIGVGFLIGVWACHVTGKNLGAPDHGSMVWDEIIAFWLVLLFIMPADFASQTWAFVIFRFFDMVKPQPIRYFDQRFKGGFGVMWDDIVAAFFTLLSLALWRIS
ncbi:MULTISPECIES: phosphatidylglycerophosphatase A [unclassified Undibacterium]|uniref:phosphatidylglycerophosphatase A family protein n=1 Tax=unclassified Undibacterium TaxID=2630295 RepID=UPI002AC9B294|nr:MULTISPECIES: phosphatidylglycerophosphatase A [unclassified Undibacterium]MEB0138193.1 phosphatidylglycerophosphatase A [Undibacterium sp. CCC2.1]MEB0171052.1 phosphatidylglycerophosphatase A [Undibacterium sp. CCC1.1]MEB0175097.1 phosphatidylglycerophosphatase A [Undibacterium sp. CCC3.4]MEB0214319.1 phosphatidylglycerophosphatase A [Undibacterium sp. 5I2]WPX41900.1 phosphatidylglycerophosphatase A [Undibacterium sp. CCC3.4]